MVTITVPSTAPVTVAGPPITSMARMTKVSLRKNALGLNEVMKCANRPPAIPAAKALSTSANQRTATMFTPMELVETKSSRDARSCKPDFDSLNQ